MNGIIRGCTLICHSACFFDKFCRSATVAVSVTGGGAGLVVNALAFFLLLSMFDCCFFLLRIDLVLA